MLLNLTEEQIIQLAPDAASVKAGKGLATRAKWVLLEHSDPVLSGGIAREAGKLHIRP